MWGDKVKYCGKMESCPFRDTKWQPIYKNIYQLINKIQYNLVISFKKKKISFIHFYENKQFRTHVPVVRSTSWIIIRPKRFISQYQSNSQSWINASLTSRIETDGQTCTLMLLSITTNHSLRFPTTDQSQATKLAKRSSLVTVILGKHLCKVVNDLVAMWAITAFK